MANSFGVRASSAAPREKPQESHDSALLHETAGCWNEDEWTEPTQPSVFEPHCARSVLEDGRASSDQLGVEQLDCRGGRGERGKQSHESQDLH